MAAAVAVRDAEVASGSALLSVQGISVRFGGIVALDELTFQVAPGEILGLIGPNGAGKTTLFDCLSRVCLPDAGDILLSGQSILDQPPHAIPQLGIARTFQSNRAVRGHERGRQRQGWMSFVHKVGLPNQRATAAVVAGRGAPDRRTGRRADGIPGP
jgi:ABC-type oligopeptide transport system ATPase subunit